MTKKKQKKEIEVSYEYAGDIEENRQKMGKAYDVLFEAVLSNLKVSLLSELLKQEEPLIPPEQSLDMGIQKPNQ